MLTDKIPSLMVEIVNVLKCMPTFTFTFPFTIFILQSKSSEIVWVWANNNNSFRSFSIVFTAHFPTKKEKNTVLHYMCINILNPISKLSGCGYDSEFWSSSTNSCSCFVSWFSIVECHKLCILFRNQLQPKNLLFWLRINAMAAAAISAGILLPLDNCAHLI